VTGVSPATNDPSLDPSPHRGLGDETSNVQESRSIILTPRCPETHQDKVNNPPQPHSLIPSFPGSGQPLHLLLAAQLDVLGSVAVLAQAGLDGDAVLAAVGLVRLASAAEVEGVAVFVADLVCPLCDG
jgi:hypothetical protein